MLRPRRSEVGRVGAPVELGHVDKLVRLRFSGEVAFAGHHVVGVLDAVVDVIHYIGRFFVFDGLEEADLEEVRRPVGAVLRALVVSRADGDFNCLVVVDEPDHFGLSFRFRGLPCASLLLLTIPHKVTKRNHDTPRN